MKIAGSTILVTGGASGLGAACVQRFVAAGAHTVIADLDQVGGEKLAAELGPAATFVRMDVTDEASVQEGLNWATAQSGRLTGAILCAGILGAQRVVGRDKPHDLELFARIVRVNLIG